MTDSRLVGCVMAWVMVCILTWGLALCTVVARGASPPTPLKPSLNGMMSNRGVKISYKSQVVKVKGGWEYVYYVRYRGRSPAIFTWTTLDESAEGVWEGWPNVVPLRPGQDFTFRRFSKEPPVERRGAYSLYVREREKDGLNVDGAAVWGLLMGAGSSAWAPRGGPLSKVKGGD